MRKLGSTVSANENPRRATSWRVYSALQSAQRHGASLHAGAQAANLLGEPTLAWA
jgi:hypothetical protein